MKVVKQFSWLMLFVFTAALLLESIGTFISVVGLSKTFNGNPVIMTMAVVLDFAKLVVVSVLYKHWNSLGLFLKSFLLPAALGTMLITSYGVAGYLSDSFQQNIQETTTITIVLDSYKRERDKLETRKKEMDQQIAQMPENYITARQRLLKSFEPELVPLNARLLVLDEKILDLSTKQITAKTDLGPIAQFADMFGITVETAISVIILLVVFVFDPLAVALVIVGNMLAVQREKLEPNDTPEPVDILDEPVPEIENIETLKTESHSVSELMDDLDEKKDEGPEIVEPVIEPVIEPSEIHKEQTEIRSALDDIPPNIHSDISEDENWRSSRVINDYLLNDLKKK